MFPTPLHAGAPCDIYWEALSWTGLLVLLELSVAAMKTLHRGAHQLFMLPSERSVRRLGRFQTTKKERAGVLGFVPFEGYTLAFTVGEHVLFHVEAKPHLCLGSIYKQVQ